MSGSPILQDGKLVGAVTHVLSLIHIYVKGWKTTRMNKVDLSILRVAVYEMKWDEDVPVGVAIDEAVELAKKYSGEMCIRDRYRTLIERLGLRK